MNETLESKAFNYEFGKFVLDPNERVLLVDGAPVHLTDKVFDTLLLLVQHNGKLLTKDEMMSSIWEESFVEEGNLTKNISRLRKTLNVDGLQLIETVPRRGYRFAAQVTQIESHSDLRVHRHLRVKFSQVSETCEELKTDDDALRNVQNPLRGTRLLFGSLAILLITGVVFIFNFRPSTNVVDSSGLINLTNNLANDDLPSWSPDGTKIAFTSNRDGPGDIYVMNADGSGTRRLTDTPAVETVAVWSPDGTKLAFDSERDGNRELYIMNSDGSNQTRLTFNPTADVGPVTFSPDGKRIAFARNASNEGIAAYNYDIYVMGVDGSNTRKLTTDPEYDAEPVWSPDGRIFFISGRDRAFKIFAIDPDGKGEVRIPTDSQSNEGAFAFTSDGKQVFCTGDTAEKNEFLQVYLINADGSNRRQITYFVDKIYRVAYSPRAQKFAVSSKKEGNLEIYTMDASNMPVN